MLSWQFWKKNRRKRPHKQPVHKQYSDSQISTQSKQQAITSIFLLSLFCYNCQTSQSKVMDFLSLCGSLVICTNKLLNQLPLNAWCGQYNSSCLYFPWNFLVLNYFRLKWPWSMKIPASNGIWIYDDQAGFCLNLIGEKLTIPEILLPPPCSSLKANVSHLVRNLLVSLSH